MMTVDSGSRALDIRGAIRDVTGEGSDEQEYVALGQYQVLGRTDSVDANGFNNIALHIKQTG